MARPNRKSKTGTINAAIIPPELKSDHRNGSFDLLVMSVPPQNQPGYDRRKDYPDDVIGRGDHPFRQALPSHAHRHGLRRQIEPRNRVVEDEEEGDHVERDHPGLLHPSQKIVITFRPLPQTPQQPEQQAYEVDHSQAAQLAQDKLERTPLLGPPPRRDALAVPFGMIECVSWRLFHFEVLNSTRLCPFERRRVAPAFKWTKSSSTNLTCGADLSLWFM